MQQTDLTKEMKQHFKGAAFVNLTEASDFLGWGRAKTRSFLEGLDHYKCGKEKRYAITDITKRMTEWRNAS